MRIEKEKLTAREASEAPVEGGAVRQQLADAFLEADENAGPAVAARAVDQALQGEHRLAGARAANQKAGAMARQPAAAQLVESLDAGSELGKELGSDFAFRHSSGIRRIYPD